MCGAIILGTVSAYKICKINNINCQHKASNHISKSGVRSRGGWRGERYICVWKKGADLVCVYVWDSIASVHRECRHIGLVSGISSEALLELAGVPQHKIPGLAPDGIRSV